MIVRSITTVIVISLLIIGATQCKKNSKTTTPASPTGPTAPTSTTTIAGQQTALTANWKLVRELYYYTNPNDSMLWYINHYTPTTCYLNLTAISYTPVANRFQATGSLLCSPLSNQYWGVPSLNNFEYNSGLYPIVYLSNDSVVLWVATSTNMKQYHVYNKTGTAPAMTSIEIAIKSKLWVAKREDALSGTGSVISSTPLVTNTIMPTMYNCDFKTTWTGSNTGYDLVGSYITSKSGNSWEDVNGYLILGGNPWRIDTLNSSKFVISRIYGGNGLRIQMQ
jgi:hypothetical protein